MDRLILLFWSMLFIKLTTYASQKNLETERSFFEHQYSHDEFIEGARFFFKQLAGGNIRWALNFITSHPDWVRIIESGTGNNVLILTVKNYSGEVIENKLIFKIIQLAPDLVLMSNIMGTTLFDVINSFDEYKVFLRQLVKVSIAAIELDEFLEEQCFYLLTKKYYRRFTDLFMENPHLIYYVDKNGKRLQKYCDEANGQLDTVDYWIEMLSL